MWKYLIAAILAGGVLWLESLLQLGVFPGGWLTYVVGVGAALVCVLMAARFGRQLSWLAMVALLAFGAVLFWGLGQDLAIYAVIAGFGMFAGMLALLFAGSPGSAHAHASGGHHVAARVHESIVHGPDSPCESPARFVLHATILL